MSNCLDQFDSGLDESISLCDDENEHTCILDSEDPHTEGHECSCGFNWL